MGVEGDATPGGVQGFLLVLHSGITPYLAYFTVSLRPLPEQFIAGCIFSFTKLKVSFQFIYC